jgi:hypothetical protein
MATKKSKKPAKIDPATSGRDLLRKETPDELWEKFQRECLDQEGPNANVTRDLFFETLSLSEKIEDLRKDLEDLRDTMFEQLSLNGSGFIGNGII